MREKLKVLWDDNRTWLYVAEYVGIAVVLLVAVLLVDLRVVPLIDHIPDVLLTSLELAKSIHSTLAGALLTITTFTFTTTMAVLTTYSSNYSPRVVENFLQQKSTMKVLGTFAGGFVYCICCLFFMRNAFSDYRILSAGIAILYAVWCVIQFVVFIFSVANAVQVQNLIAGLYADARALIGNMEETDGVRRTGAYDVSRFEEEIPIVSTASGNLEIVDSEAVFRTLGERAYSLLVCARIGDFVCKGETLAILYSRRGQAPLSREETQQLQAAFGLESKRFTIRDYRFAIQKIVDIALRALSPGINDPGTAISCIQSLGLLCGKLSQIDGGYAIAEAKTEDGSTREIIMEAYNFEADLYSTYSQIVHYGKGDIMVVLALLNAMKGVLLHTVEANRPAVAGMAAYIYEAAKPGFTQQADLDRLEQCYTALNPAPAGESALSSPLSPAAGPQ